MKLDYNKVARIEAATRDQSECELWFVLCNGRLTSSKFGEILYRRSSTNPGKENEERAQRCYIENRRDAGELMEVLPSGLHLMPKKAYFGASTDGKVVCRSVDTCCTGCLEIKCPYSITGNITVEMSPQCIAEKYDKFFLKKGADDELHLSQNHPYYAQVQGELAVLDRKWCDLIVFSNGEIVVDQILADLEH